MFSLSDFHHLPQLDFYVQQIARQGHGLVVVAGLGQIPDAGLPAGRTFLPSGRSLILTILLQEMLKAQIDIQALVISQDKSAFRLNRPLRDRISYALVDERNNYAQLIEQAALRNPGLIVVDQLNEQSIGAALRAARQGVQVLSQLDTVMFGSAAVRQLVDWGGAPEDLPGLSWIVGVQRVETLCQVCKKSIQLDEALEMRLRRRFPHLVADNPAPASPSSFGELALPKADFYNASGCERCRESGRSGGNDLGSQASPQIGRPYVVPVRMTQQQVMDLAGIDACGFDPLQGIGHSRGSTGIDEDAALGRFDQPDVADIGMFRADTPDPIDRHPAENRLDRLAQGSGLSDRDRRVPDDLAVGIHAPDLALLRPGHGKPAVGAPS